MTEAMQNRANARAAEVSRARQEEIRAGLEYEEGALIEPTTDTMTLRHPNGDISVYRNHGTADAAVIGVNKVWPGGASAGNLNGGGLTAAAWGSVIGQFEQRIPYFPHVEFGSPTRVGNPSSFPSADGHATSVAGIMIAQGIDAAAKGMAYTASIDAYSWDDPFGDILDQTASGMRVSNHSHGTVSGWDFVQVSFPGPYLRTVNLFRGDILVSTAESPYFGLYDENARLADETGFLQPYQLLVPSAGNSRGRDLFDQASLMIYVGENPYFLATSGGIANDTPEFVLFNGTNYWELDQGDFSVEDPNTEDEQIVFTPAIGQAATSLSGTPGPDGGLLGYDTLPNGLQTSKNALVVGAVTTSNDLWTQAQTTSLLGQGTVFGPTDDGRIKPDVMANGVDVYTPALTFDEFNNPNNDGYAEGSATGTSFASPGVAGGVALLTELQERSVNYGDKEPLRAATLKGAIIHTAADVTPTGPDYQSGWGIAQIDKAAELIQANFDSTARTFVKEVVLNDGDVVAFTVRATGSEAVKVTASWADRSCRLTRSPSCLRMSRAGLKRRRACGRNLPTRY